MHGTIKGLFIENGPQWRGPTCTYLVICLCSGSHRLTGEYVPAFYSFLHCRQCGPQSNVSFYGCLRSRRRHCLWSNYTVFLLSLLNTKRLVQLFGILIYIHIYIYMIFFLTIWYWSKCILAWGDEIWIWFLCMIWNRSELNYVALMSN